MTGRKFWTFLIVVFVIAVIVYAVSTPHESALELTGTVDGNEVIASPQIAGRITQLLVDEGSQVKQGDLIAELDPRELQASLAAAKANVATLESTVREAQNNFSWTSDQTAAALEQASDTNAATRDQLRQARAQLTLDQADLARVEKLYEKGEVSAQERDHAQAAVNISQASVAALEHSVHAGDAALAVAQANRKQVDVRKSALSSSIAQLEQARASEAQISTQLSYTQIRAPLGGIVSVRAAKQGEVIQPGSPIVVILDVDHLWVRADVPETYIDSITFGEKLGVRLPSGGELEGTVFYKGVEGDFATERDVSRTKRDIKTFAIKVAVPNPQRRLFSGMTATVIVPRPSAGKSWFSRL